MGKVDEALLKRIADHQMLHGSFRRDLGVLNGKMGIVLFFFHYARYTGRVLYEDFAGEMLEEVIQVTSQRFADFVFPMVYVGIGVGG